MLKRLDTITLKLFEKHGIRRPMNGARAAEATGRPLGSDEFVTQLERQMQRRLRRQKPGRKAKAAESAGDLLSPQTMADQSIG